jgi:hypothetical protein
MEIIWPYFLSRYLSINKCPGNNSKKTCGWGEWEEDQRVKIIRWPSDSACKQDELIPNQWGVNGDYRSHGEWKTFIYDFKDPAYTGKFQLPRQVYFNAKPFGNAVTFTVEILTGK